MGRSRFRAKLGRPPRHGRSGSRAEIRSPPTRSGGKQSTRREGPQLAIVAARLGGGPGDSQPSDPPRVCRSATSRPRGRPRRKGGSDSREESISSRIREGRGGALDSSSLLLRRLRRFVCASAFGFLRILVLRRFLFSKIWSKPAFGQPAISLVSLHFGKCSIGVFLCLCINRPSSENFRENIFRGLKSATAYLKLKFGGY
ncbi:hypothetical protein NL676_009772 [Syzygium grande]|nr:hypothetical protein NL676_009772 [Syzygium grande]